MICSHCASEMPDVSSFCPGCGRSIHEEADYLNATSTQEALAGAVAYLTFIPAVSFLVIPAFKDKPFVRFHAWQSVFFTGVTLVLGAAMRLIFAILSFVPFIGVLFAWLSLGLVFLAIVVLWAVLVVKAGQGQAYELPWLGQFAARLTQ